MGGHKDARGAESQKPHYLRGDSSVKTLVAGWFSFEQMEASAGDLLARDLVCE